MPAIAKALIWKKEKEEEKNWCCRKYDRLAPLSVNSCAEADCFTSSRSCSIELGPGTVISGAFAYTMNYFFPTGFLIWFDMVQEILFGILASLHYEPSRSSLQKRYGVVEMECHRTS